MTTAVILQVRLDSTRLPRKALLPLGGSTLTACACRALRGVEADRFVLATEPGSAACLAPIAEECGFALFVGPKDDVLERYCLAAESVGADRIVRATGDNPLVSSELANLLLALHEAEGADFSAFDGPPIGTGVEVVESSAYFAARRDAPPLKRPDGSPDPEGGFCREHASPFIYRHPERFTVRRFSAGPEFCLPGAKVTVDTADDYRFVEKIFHELYTGVPIPMLALVEWLKEHGDEGLSA
jgi:spore coat polysaccharide biosynthesis protein SpsF